MLRLSDEEYEMLLAIKPPAEDFASFARAALVASARRDEAPETLRRAASFIVASLSPDFTFEEALDLFDEHVLEPRKEHSNGRSH
jgi:hypothetical protein